MTFILLPKEFRQNTSAIKNKTIKKAEINVYKDIDNKEDICNESFLFSFDFCYSRNFPSKKILN